MRVYIPLDRRGLEDLAASGEVSPRPAYAVTPAFAEAYGSDDVEELEYAAISLAAEQSQDDQGYQVVVAADVTEARPVDEQDPAVVPLGRPVPLADVASIHVGAADEELAWYAPRELAHLLAAD